MSAPVTSPIPYERQGDPQEGRMCGAAALSMVYRSFEKSIAQPEIWPNVTKYNRFGSLSAASHLMAKHALSEGFAALVVQVKYPLQVLKRCQENGIRAILNHRLKEDVPTGHFSVLVDIDDTHVTLHDPYFGPSRRVPHAELFELWRPRYLNAEIAGNVLIGIAPQPSAPVTCQLCGTAIPPSVDCPSCQKAVPLAPATLLGCVGSGCAARLWNFLCCPFCDYTWTFALTESPTATESDKDPWKLTRVFDALDKFLAPLLESPKLANDPDLRRQMEFIKAGQDRLKLAQTESRIRREMLQAELTQIQKKSQQDKEAVVRAQEETTRSSPSLDGNALGLALVKDLGLLMDTPTAPAKLIPTTDQDILAFLKKKGLLREQ